MNYTLIVLAVLLLVFAIVGAKKGLIKMAFSLASIIVVMLLTSFLEPKISTLLKEKTDLYNVVTSKTESYYQANDVLKYSDEDLTLEDLPIPQAMRDKLQEDLNDAVTKGYDAYNEYIVTATSDIIFSAIVYVTVFVTIYIIVGVVFLILNVASKLPVLKQLNGLAGCAVGLVFGLLVIWVLFLVVTLFSNYAFMARVIEDIENSKILTTLYNMDPLIKIIMAFM